MTNYCPSCAEEVIEPSNAPDCQYLIVEEFPELVLPPPKIGYVNKYQRDEWTPRKILQNELAKCGMNLQQFRIVSVYPHLPPDSGMPNDNCYNFGMEQVIEEAFGKLGIIFLGGNLCKTFTGYDLKQVQGLSGVSSKSFLTVGCTVYLPTIRTIYATGAGEFRVGISRFVKQLKEKTNETEVT